MIIITGASCGIGRYLLEQKINAGEKVLGIFNKTIPDSYSDNYIRLDLRDEHAIADFAENYASKFDRLILINAAGISYNAFAHKAQIEKWHEVIQTNLIGLFSLTKTFLPQMREQQFGRIINFSSVVAQHGVAGTSAYAASKAGLWGLSKTLAVENAGKNITVNNINLGYFNIGMIEQVPAPTLTNIINSIPAKRLGMPHEILSTVDYIISNAYLNGASIDLNGGLF